ncbi:MAG: DUF262 domain-containing protein, partial [Hormoscilla sp. GM102CHS1]|nr:DUF262 domain-containing protein [Hormoscilla sp. GM102CHS1]
NSKSLDVFLNQTMADINQMEDAEIELLEAKFKWAMVAAFELFGKYGFRKREQANPEKRFSLNKALFEAWSFNLGQLDEKQLQTLKERKSYLQNKFIDMMENDENFQSSISQGTSTVSKVKYRFSAIENMILEMLC